MAGLIPDNDKKKLRTPYFNNLLIDGINHTVPNPAPFPIQGERRFMAVLRLGKIS
jgi:hypothetical protein